MSHTGDREANILGAFSVAVTDRVQLGSGDAALLALHTWLAGASIDRLARVLGLSHSGAVRLADRLATAGLLERAGGADARAVALRLTGAGHAHAARLQADRLARLDAVLEPLSATERVSFIGLVGQILGGMVPDRAAAGRTCRTCDPDVCGHPERCPVTQAVPH